MTDSIKPPSNTNTAANIVNDIIAAGLNGGKAAVEAYIIALDPGLYLIPILGPILKDLLDDLVGDVETPVYAAIAKFATALVIKTQASEETQTVQTAAQSLSDAEAKGDTDAIATSTQDLINAWGNLIHSDGQSTNTASPNP